MRKKNYTYKWQTASQFSLLVNGEVFYPDIIGAINTAKYNIYIIQYLVNSGQITNDVITALVDAAARGVCINIILDDYGSSGLSLSDRKKLRNANINLVLYNPFLLKKLFQYVRRDHRKLFIVDEKIAYTGGVGISDEFDTHRNPGQGWQDIMIRMQGCIVNDWVKLFFDSWNCFTAPQAPDLRPEHIIKEATKPHNDVDINLTECTHAGRINLAYRRNQEVVRSITNHFHRATQDIIIVTPYFVATRKIRRNLIKASRRGVDVKIIVPGPHSDHPWINHISRHYYSKLLKNNVQIFEYQPRFIHTKLVLCDNWLNVGSCNLDRWSMHFNLDANIEIVGESFHEQVNDYIEKVLLNSRAINPETWRNRSWLARLKEWFWSKLALWVERLTQASRY